MYGPGIQSVIGPAAMATTDTDLGTESIYVMGGFDNLAHGRITEMTIPSDLCQLIQDAEECVAVLGCAACVDTAINKTYCYTNEDPARFE